MDPSIMKMLEDDDDETMHSGADLEAFTAALNRDIGRDDSDVFASTEAVEKSLPPPDSVATEYAQQESSEQWQISNQEGESMHVSFDKILPNLQFQAEHVSEMGLVKNENSSQFTQEKVRTEQEESQQVENGGTNIIESKQILNSKQNHLSQQENVAKETIGSKEHQKQPISQLSNQQPQTSLDAATNPARKMKLSSISFYTLIPVLRPHLDKDKFMQLNNALSKLKNNEITRDYFLRVIRNTVGDQMLRKTVHQVMQAQALSARNSQLNQNQHQLQGQSSSQQVSVRNARHLDNQSISQVRTAALSSGQHQRTLIGRSEAGALTVTENSGQGVAGTQMTSTMQERVSLLHATASSKQQNHSQLPHGVPMQHVATTGSFVTHQFQRPNGGGLPTLKSQTQDSQLRQIPFPPRMLSSQSGATQPTNLTNISNKPPSNKEQGVVNSSSTIYIKQEVPEQLVESCSGPQFPASSGSSVRISDQVNSSLSKDIKIEKQPSRISLFTSTSIMSTPNMTGLNAFSPDQVIQVSGLSGSNAKTPLKKPFVGQKKPLEAQSTPPLPSKKQKLSGAYQDLSIEQLNDVTAVSGVDLREEEEQLLNALKEDSRASEAIRRVVQEEEEERLIVQSVLQKKIAEILFKYGLKSVSTDFERCISACVEDRLRGFISNLIRISKQRVDSEKPRHRIVFTSDVRREVLAMNRKAKEELDKKQAEEAEKLRKQNEGDGNAGDDTEKDRDESRLKLPKAANKDKDEDDKMRATAANVAARAAVGGDDMLSKWQLMAEQARQKREGGVVGGSDRASTPSEPSKTVAPKQTVTSGNISMDALHPGKNLGNGSSSSAGILGRNTATSTSTMPHVKVKRSILAKDVIAVLEREPQMYRSILLYRLLNRI